MKFATRLIQLAAPAGLVWSTAKMKEDFVGFLRMEEVLVRQVTETPDAQRGVVSFWVFNPKTKNVTILKNDLFRESVYKSGSKTIVNPKIDKVFLALVTPKLQAQVKQRRRFGYILYQFNGKHSLKLSDSLTHGILAVGDHFTIQMTEPKVWSVLLNNNGTVLEITNFTEAEIKSLVKQSNEIKGVPKYPEDYKNRNPIGVNELVEEQ